MESNNLITMKGIHKTFPGVIALNNVDFSLKAGEVHSLMGENGAGKSTLIKVLTGVFPFEAGEIYLNSEKVLFNSPLESQEAKISTVYQEVNLCSNLSVTENIFIGREIKRFGLIQWKEMHRHAQELLKRFYLDIDVTKPVGDYSVAIQQMISIARSVDIEAKVLILDEPTSSLNEQETQNLFTVIRELKQEGMGIIFISHFLDQIYEICDAITILRNGSFVGTYDIDELSQVELVSKMIGKDFGDMQAIQKSTTIKTEKFIEMEDVSVINKIKPMDLDINKGEVVGLAGLLGSGRTEIAQLLFGVFKQDHGKIKVCDKETIFNHPIDAMNAKIALCPEDRKDLGIIGDLSVRENIILAIQAKQGIMKHISREKQNEIADYYIDLLQIKVSNREQAIKTLSGGNQQKVIIARWLATHPELLILDEPTRGIDIGTKTEIQKLVIKLSEEEDVSVVFISSELDEMTRTCSRIAVMRDHEKIGEIIGEDINSDNIMKTIAGGAAYE